MSRDHDDARPKRLRVPAALAVAFVGSSTAISMWYGGCHTEPDPPVDAGFLELRDDANQPTDASLDASIDDAPPPDAPRDATVPQPPPDAPEGPDH